jgi:hypothetical protein
MALENDRTLTVTDKPLKQWQEDLLSHFNQLYHSRKTSGLTVFALEHGLEKPQLENIFSQLRRDLNSNGLSRSHWLLWVIYATELGYSYDGDEYWQSFQERTPNWSIHFREDIRWAFVEFQKKFGGVKPSGAWANHFSIIAWPITHAILPKDLLAYFARLLYEARYKLVKTKLDDAELVGKILHSNAHNIHSPRFHNFLQQEELVGRIALAMIDTLSVQANVDRIYNPTLKRIVSDLEKRGHAKEWMNVVRRDIKTRILGTASSDKTGNENHRVTSYQKKIFFKPRLSLRRAASNTWDLTLDLPSFSTSLENSDFTKFLKKTRFKITGANGTWIPADELLYGVQRKLIEWPSDQSLISFEKENAFATNLLSEECKIDNSSVWLFRIGQDGIAHEIAGRMVRPGLKYVVLSKSERTFLDQLSTPCQVNCGGIVAQQINVPVKINNEIEENLKIAGLRVAKTIRVSPVGLPARSWDGEGLSEWLSTETPCFEITHDHPIEEFHILLGNLSAVLKGKPANVPTFFKLPKLPQGRHTLVIKPVIRNGSSDGLQGMVLLEVRDPISWTPGTLLHSGLNSFFDPPDNNLDSFLFEKTKIKVYGPSNRTVTINLEFYGGNQLIKTIGPKVFPLPIEGNALSSMCSEAMKDEEIQVAKRMKLIVSGDELGQRIHSFQRDIAPLRWLFKSKHEKNYLRIIDETDSPEALKLMFFSFDNPVEEKLLTVKDWLHGQETNLKGMFIAKKGKHEHTITLSSLQSNKTFDGLGISPSLPKISQTNRVALISEFESHAQKWYKSRCVNLIAHLHRQKVLDFIVQNMIKSLCGQEWADAESRFMSSQDIAQTITGFSNKIGNRSLADVMRYRIQTKNALEVRPDEEKKWFIGAVERCGITSNKSIAYFAIKFGANPLIIDDYFGEDFSKKFIELERNPVLIKAARFYALGISKIVEPNKTEIFLPAGWKW